MKTEETYKIARIIKNLNAFDHLMQNIRFNYNILVGCYAMKDEVDDVEYKDVECAFNNFVLISSIVKQHIKSFEKDLDIKFLKTKKYCNVVNYLFNDKLYLIFLGLRNYLQHVFHFKISFGNMGGDEEELFISNFTLLKIDDMKKRTENQAMQRFFKHCWSLPIMDFSLCIMDLIENFYKKYQKVIKDHYKSKLNKYDKSSDIDQYAMDMHDIYFENLTNINNKEFEK